MTKPFKKEIHITRPLLPDLNTFYLKLQDIWSSQWLSNFGKQHNELETKIKEFLKVENASLFNNGTTALMTAVNCLKLKGEVITTPFTFPATTHVLSWSGIKPVFCDINEQTLNIDADKIEKLITKKTTGILAVHVFGVPCDIPVIAKIAKKHGLKVIYDAAHAFGTEIDCSGIGSFGDVTMFSFHPTKLFHTGEGGCLTFKDKKLNINIKLAKNFGIKNQEEVVIPGINGKMNEIQAALGLVNLDIIKVEMDKRKNILKTYYKELSGINGISFYKNPSNIKNSYQYFVIKINEKEFGRSRDYVYEEFKKYNVFTRKYFYPLCSEYPCYKKLPSSKPSLLKTAHKTVNEVLCMPFYGRLEVNDIIKICEILRGFKRTAN